MRSRCWSAATRSARQSSTRCGAPTPPVLHWRTRGWEHLDEAARYLDLIVAGARPSVGDGQAIVVRFNAAEAALLLNRPAVALELIRPALDRARELGTPGHEAYSLFALAEVGRHSDLLDASTTEQSYREALALAVEWEMRPLQARCHLGLGALLRTLGRHDEAQGELTLAIEMLRAMGMTYWLPEAEAGAEAPHPLTIMPTIGPLSNRYVYVTSLVRLVLSPAETTSPPARVTRRAKMRMSMLAFRKCTEPSAKTAFAPPG